MPDEAVDSSLMQRALVQAARCLQEGTMPIGAVLACDGEVLAEAHWRGLRKGVLKHPEHVVLLEADGRVAPGMRRRCTLYTTLEPCLMCMGTAMSFGLGRIMYALSAPADGAADVATRWAPRHGHPPAGIPYSIPEVDGGLKADVARSLIERWLATGVAGGEADFAQRTLA
jgi:tRNA(adenine34) deaminase